MNIIRKFSDYLINEDGDGGAAYADASNTAGMGAVISPQPSTNIGNLNDPGYISGGGVAGSGDFSMPMVAVKKAMKQNDKFNKRFNKTYTKDAAKIKVAPKTDFKTYPKVDTDIKSFSDFVRDDITKFKS
jgi:hypothetical protein